MTMESALLAALAQKLVDTAAAHLSIPTTGFSQLPDLERDRILTIASEALQQVCRGPRRVESRDYCGVLTDSQVNDYTPRPFDYARFSHDLSVAHKEGLVPLALVRQGE